MRFSPVFLNIVCKSTFLEWCNKWCSVTLMELRSRTLARPSGVRGSVPVASSEVIPDRDGARSKSNVVKNHQKFWTIFWPSQIFGGGHCKNCTHVITPASRDVDWRKSHEDIPTNPEIIEAHTLNFRPNF